MSTQFKNWVLVGIGGPVRGREFVLMGNEIRLGRGSDNDITLPDGNSSRNHALIKISDLECAIEDLQSKNGILVNNKTVAKQMLKQNDSICIGDCQFKLIKESEHGLVEATKRLSLKEILYQLECVIRKAHKILEREGLSRLPILWSRLKGVSKMHLPVGHRKKMLITSVLSAIGFGLIALFLMPNRKTPSASPIPPMEALPSATASAPTQPLNENEIDNFDTLEARASAAIEREDWLGAIPLLKKMVVIRQNDPRSRQWLLRAESNLSSMIENYFESGAREYEKLDYDRAIAEWQKVMALSETFDTDKHKQARKRIEEAKSRLASQRQ